MRIQVLYFAAIREVVGKEGEMLELDGEQMSLDEFTQQLSARHPTLRRHLGHLRVAVNERFVGKSETLVDGDRVALIPPVAGGSTPASVQRRVAIRAEALCTDAVLSRVRHPGAGAVAMFLGTVRNVNEGKRVTGLTYQAYDAMALAEMRRIVEEIETDLPGVRLAAEHRTGALEVGDIAVVCAASAPHREEAFQAGRRLIDTIKERVPIWKLEDTENGAHWVGWTES